MAAIPRQPDAASPEAALADMSQSAKRLNRWIALVIAGLLLAPMLAVLGGAAWLREIAVSEGRARLAEVLEMTVHHTQTVMAANVEVGRRVALVAADAAPEALRGDRALHLLLADIASRHGHIDSIAVVDRDGAILSHSAAFPAPPRARIELPPLPGSGADGTITVLPPAPRLAADGHAFGLVVPRLADGVPVGAVVVSISTDYLARAYAKVSPFADFALEWVDADGWVLARHPALPRPLRIEPAASGLLRAWRSGAKGGELDEPSPVDGVRRVTAWRAIGPKVVAVSVAGGRSGLARAHDRVAFAFGLALVLASGAIGALAFSLRRAARAHANLVECVIDADEARRKAEDQLRQAQKLESVGLLTGGVAHDFNNLLAILMGCTESLQARFASDPGVHETTDVMMTTIERGARLTADLLSFARKQMLFPVACDVSVQIQRSRTLLAKAAGEANLLVFDLAPRPLPVRVDPAHLDACLINLISNAHDVIERDGRIVVRTRLRVVRPGESDATGVEPGRYAVIDVEDNGRGMPPEVASRAFEPFYTTKALGRGTGLGLAMVYGFAQQSGGTAVIESQPGRGTRVSVLLPLTADSVTPALPRPQAVPERIAAHVLLVDDDATVRHVMAETLRSLGATVSEAADAASARARLADDRPDLMVTDVVMPGDMNGYELALWARRGGRILPTLLISGFAGSQLPDALAKQAAIAFLPKPIARADLAVAIAGLLRSGESRGDGTDRETPH